MAIARGLPENCRPYENNPAAEVDECLLTHIGPEHIDIHIRQVWALGIYVVIFFLYRNGVINHPKPVLSYIPYLNRLP